MTEWDKVSPEFNDWWEGDYDDSKNPFREDSPAYWAWAGWQAALQWSVNQVPVSEDLEKEIAASLEVWK